MSRSRESDLEIIIKLRATIDDFIYTEDNRYIKVLQEIGQLVAQISWSEEDKNCIRNNHGYRTRYKKDGNALNSEGAKLDFETLAHLRDLDETIDVEKYFRANLVIPSLKIIRNKAEFILSKEQHSMNLTEKTKLLYAISFWKDVTSENEEIGFLRYLSAYNQDKNLINTLLKLFGEMDTAWYKSLNVHEKAARYALGYLFVEIGEAAKEISEFIKCGSSENSTLTKLFSKLANYRDEIKVGPYIVSAETPLRLLKMKQKLDIASQPIVKLLESLRNILNTLDLTEVHTYDDTLLKLLGQIDQTQPDKGGFEQQYAEILKNVAASLVDGTTNWKKKQVIIERAIAELEGQIQQRVLEIEQKKAQFDVYASNVTNATPDQEEKINVFSSKKAKELLPQFQHLLQEFLAKFPHKMDERFITFHSMLDQSILDISGSLMSDDEKSKNKSKLISLKTVSSKISKNLIKFLDNQHLATENLSISELLNVLNGLDRAQEDNISIQKEIDSMLDTISKKKTQILEHKITLEHAIQEDAEIKHMLQVLPKNSQTNTGIIDKSSILKFDALILDVIEETSNMYDIYVELLAAIASKNINEIAKLHRAEKMCFGFLGQNHKELKKDFKDKMGEVLIQKSILSDDCFEVMQIRHKQLMHNVTRCDGETISIAVREQIIPWQKILYVLRIALQKMK